jgi:NADH-quinone oxidoreductase subunit H
MWIRGTFPRVRIDQLMQLGWKWLIPLSLALIVVTGTMIKVYQLSGGVS